MNPLKLINKYRTHRENVNVQFITDKSTAAFTVKAPSGTVLTVDWGDGTPAEDFAMTGNSVSVSHDYGTEKVRGIKFSGTANAQITYLQCRSNFKNINVAEYTELTYLDCGYNRLTALDLSQNVNLVTLKCVNNFELGSLIISDSCKTTLERLEISSARKLTSLDLSNFTALTYLDCWGSSLLATLNVSGCTALAILKCFSCKISSLNVTGCTALTELQCYFNQIGSLNISTCAALTELNCFDNNLSSLNISGNPALTQLDYGRNNISNVDISAHTGLIELGFAETPIASIDLSAHTALLHLACRQCYNLTSINISAQTLLQYFDCSLCTGITSIDVNHNPELKSLWCDSMGLSSLNISNNSKLEFLWCQGNHLSSATINAHLAKLVASNVDAFTMSYSAASQDPPAPPTGQGITDKATLISRGWSVSTD
jgi:Leucine-rich repeat (LRR) protein